jgi:endonuclease/exonuclease/phosphatase family metal-dependent hydrolase
MMRVASYNIRKAVGLDWRRDADRIMRVLAEIDADIVVLQEADRRTGDRAGVLPVVQMQQELGYQRVDFAVRPKSHGWHGNAIFYRDTLLEFDRPQRVILPSLEPRGAVSALFATPHIEIIGVHLALVRATRLGQLRALADHMSAATHPVLIAGDFNAWRHDTDVANVFGENSEMIVPGNSFHAAWPAAALDRFVLKGAVQHVSSHVHQSASAARASDHLPVVIDIAVRKQVP